MTLPRRTWLKLGGAAALAALPLPLILGRRRERASHLVRDPSGVLDLAPGLSYRVLSRTGSTMSDGLRVPGMPDGMACFPLGAERWVLMRNHEVGRMVGQGAVGPSQTPPTEAYDPTAHGGVTRVVLEPKSLSVESENLVLTGTLRNCAGGVSPWGWLSCEESVEAGHGYVFLCRTDATRVAAPHKIPSYGRFNHEAAVVDPTNLVAYLSEDRSDGCLYRFVPKASGRPFEGRLQAMALPDAPSQDTARGFPLGRRQRVEWVDIDEPDPKTDTVRKQAHARGAAKIRRGEGLWLAQGVLYLAATTGGSAGVGQIFRLHLEPRGDTFELLAESPGEDVLDCPDNLTIAPSGDVIIAEDGSGEQLIRGITLDGRVYDIARNAKSRGEIAGVCFSPDGRVMFANLQREGLTLAISGDFARVRAGAPKARGA